MTLFKEVTYIDIVPHNIHCILAADIGGTNSNFGIFTYNENNIRLIFSLHTKSQKITNFADVVHDAVSYAKQQYNITITRATLAAAGLVSENHDYVKPTNLNIVIDSNEILKKVDLTCAFIVNDFEVIGYGLNLIDPSSIIAINTGKIRTHANKAILGAGTGLGKCMMYWDKHVARHVPVVSEGGHTDFPVQNKLELDLIEYIQHTAQFNSNVSWENLLSGSGIQHMYNFFKKRETHDHAILTRNSITEELVAPDEIFNSRFNNESSLKTCELYTKLYARCAKNFALDALAFDGVYIVGGIAAKNLPLFQLKAFMEEFINCAKHEQLLKEIPIYVVTDYNISLYGAAQYMLLEEMCA